LSFVEQWADPNDAVWSEPVMSACASGSTNPDRVIFTGVNWAFTTDAQWETQQTAASRDVQNEISDRARGRRSSIVGPKVADLMGRGRSPSLFVIASPAATHQPV
jgi:hypothetical protein